MRYLGQHAIITGGSSGIGRAVARLFVAEGAHVSILARRQGLLDETIAELEEGRCEPSQRLLSRSVDLSSWQQTNGTISELIGDGHVPRYLINAAGYCHPGYFEELPLEAFHSMMDVDYFGTVHPTKAVVPSMIAQGGGHIVNFSSVAGFMAVFGFTAYSAAKYAIAGFSEALRQEMKPHGIHVSVVYPPTTRTPGLETENRLKPIESWSIEGQVTPRSADYVARSVLRGIERRQRHILPGFDTKLAFLIAHLPPFLVSAMHWFLFDRVVARARKTRGL